MPPTCRPERVTGPAGAAALARALYRGLGAVPVYICETIYADPIIAASRAAHIMVKDFADARDKRLGSAIATAPSDQAKVADWAKRVFDELQPKALISIERLGPNEHGIIHNATGWAIGPETGIIDLTPIITEAENRGVFSIGIGDYGNEIGFGCIEDAVKEVMPYGATARDGPRRQRLRGEDRCLDPGHDVQLGRLRHRGRPRLPVERPRRDSQPRDGNATSSPSAWRLGDWKACIAPRLSSWITAKAKAPWPWFSCWGTWFDSICRHPMWAVAH